MTSRFYQRRQAANYPMRINFDRVSSRISWILLALSLLCIGLEWSWKPVYVWGGVSGIYWLLILVGGAVFPLAIVSLTGGIISGFIWILRSFQRDPKQGITGVLVFRLTTAGIVFMVAVYQAVISLWARIDTLIAGERTYYQANTTLFEINFGLFESDRYGIFSRQVYRSDNYIKPIQIALHYDKTTGTILIESNAGEIIHTHVVPKD